MASEFMQSGPVSSGRAPGERFLNVERGISMLGSEQSLRMILQTVNGSMMHDIPEISRLLEAGEVPTANRLLHAIKGYVPVFCSDALIEQVIYTERLSTTGTAEVVKPAFAALAPKLQSLLTEVQLYMDVPVRPS
jgi:HPt (histidine-containing phosphotransfer) domain-containing protein